MYVKQNLTILFYRKGKKADKQGKAPLYVRVTIDGMKDEISLGSKTKVGDDDFNRETKLVESSEPTYKTINKLLEKAKVDLERHFDLIQAQEQIATPAMVFLAYKTPIRAVKTKEEKLTNQAFSLAMDELVYDYIKYHKKNVKAHLHGKTPVEALFLQLEKEKKELDQAIEKIAKEGAVLFDDKKWEKTITLSIDEHLLSFMQLASTGHRSPNTLERMWGRKRRYQEFLNYRYKGEDMPLFKLEYKFLEQLKSFCMVQKKINQNSATKIAQSLKEITERSAMLGWIATSPFLQFRCSYTETPADWLTPEEMVNLLTTEFKDPMLNIIRDCFVFCSFTGLSYQEVFSLGPEDIMKGIDGKQWINKDRQKTDGDESLPLLPVALEMMDKYKDHPESLRRNKFFPVPTNTEYNRGLKIIAEIKGFRINLRTHKGRYYFANEVCFNNGVQTRTIGRMLGQKSPKSADRYVRPNRRAISMNMEVVETNLFDENGKLRMMNNIERTSAKVIPLHRV